ncbi:hypothetical protein KJ359_007907 [Pestalotiopsis sp. 9143b]|nr:hypothetical protein KJ359_007907 [Pestalotiopsis sp. 9143b]
MGYSRIQDLRSEETGSRDRHTIDQQRRRVQERSRASIVRGWHEPSWRRHRVVRQRRQQPSSNSSNSSNSNAAAPAKHNAVRVLRPGAAVAAPVSRAAAAAKASRVAAAKDSLAAAINAANAVRAPRPDAVVAAPASGPAAGNAVFAAAVAYANAVRAPATDAVNAPASRACGVMKPDGRPCQGDIVCREHTYAQRCAVPNRGGQLPPEGAIIRRYHLEKRKERWEKARKQKEDANKK